MSVCQTKDSGIIATGHIERTTRLPSIFMQRNGYLSVTKIDGSGRIVYKQRRSTHISRYHLDKNQRGLPRYREICRDTPAERFP